MSYSNKGRLDVRAKPIFIVLFRMQVPSNVLLSRLRPSVYLPTLELVWSISTLLMGFVQNVYQVYPIRVILGLAEAGFYPGVRCCWFKV